MQRHIGHWLKHLDRLIEDALLRILAEERLTRRHWQTMNVLSRSPRTEAELVEGLRPFWGAGAITLAEVTGELAGRGWLTGDGDRYALTPAGAAAHAAVEQKVFGIRDTLQAGLRDEDYHHTMRVLRHMAENLERSGPA